MIEPNLNQTFDDLNIGTNRDRGDIVDIMNNPMAHTLSPNKAK